MADAVHTAERLKELQALPLDRKIQISQTRIIEWYQRNKGNVVVSFSGGKDSTVLLHLVRSIYPDVPAVFSNTGLEYPEIFRFVQTFPNVEIVRPNMVFSEVISTYGYPLIGKEVAEAIYYARRIRSQSVQVERERENKGRITLLKRLELLGSRKLAGGGSGIADGNSSDYGHFIDTNGAKNRRTILSGKWWGKSTRMLLQGQFPSGGGTWKSTGDGTISKDAIKPMDGRLPQGNIPKMGLARTMESRGKWGDYHRRSLNPDYGNENDRECFFNRKTEWSDWRRGCL